MGKPLKNAAKRKKYREATARVEQIARELGKDPSKCNRCGKLKGKKGSLHWHHMDPTTKSFDISHRPSTTEKALRRELEKCERICKSCHYYHHSVGGQGSIWLSTGSGKKVSSKYCVRVSGFPTIESAERAKEALIKIRNEMLEEENYENGE